MREGAPKQVVIVGGGFAGLAAARTLGNHPGFDVVLIDRRNHHLFQPLLYQVAMAGLSPADIAAPIRSLLSEFDNVAVMQGEVTRIDVRARQVHGDFGVRDYDYLLLATGARHTYFGHDEWEPHAPGLKTLAQATEIRRRVLHAFELAEIEQDTTRRRALLTFVVIGGGPTGVELAGAIGEMSRRTLARDFRNIDPTRTRVVLIEAGKRILAAFPEELAAQATRDLEGLGVQVWTESAVTDVRADAVHVGDEVLQTRTVLWAAGVEASPLGAGLGAARDPQGRVHVEPDLSLAGHAEVFVAGDLAHVRVGDAGGDGGSLPGVAPVAMQAGRHVAQSMIADDDGKPRSAFEYSDKGQMATIGRGRAIVQTRHLRLTGFLAWITWLVIHIYYLSSFRNRLLVLLQWAWSYVTFGRGARLIVPRDWMSDSSK